MVETKNVTISGAAMIRRGHSGVNGRVARGRNRGQDRAQFPDLGVAIIDPTLKITKKPSPVSVRNAIEND